MPPEQIEEKNTRVVLDEEKNTFHTETNIYPTLRHIFIILCLVLAFACAIFLIYQNGKSIYANGI